MKKTMTILTLVITGLLLSNDAKASQLYIRTQAFNAKAIISGEQFVGRGGEIFAGNLRSGSHHVSIKQLNRNGHPNNFNSRSNLLFRGRVFVPNRSTVYAHVARNGRLVIDHVVPSPMRQNQGNRGRGYDDGYNRNQGNRYGQGQRNGRDRDYGNDGRRDSRDRDQWDNRDRGGDMDNRNDRDNNQNRGDDRDTRNGRDQDNRQGGQKLPGKRGNNAGESTFGILLDMINEEPFESNKLALAKNFVFDNAVASRDVLMLMEQMNFESSRLELAKFAYPNAIDKQNYFMVKRAFQYSSSSRKLDKFIQ